MSVKDPIYYVLRRLNVKAAAMFLAVFLAVSGIVMIWDGIKDDGWIDLKTATVEGKLRSGFVGVVIVMSGFVISTTCLFSRTNTHVFEIKRGTYQVKWTGCVQILNADVIDPPFAATRPTGKIGVIRGKGARALSCKRPPL